MSNGSDLERLGGMIREINAHDADRVNEFIALVNDDGFSAQRDQLGDFAAGLGFGAAADGDFRGAEPSVFSASQAGAEAFVSVLKQHPAFSDDRRVEVGLSTFGDYDDPNLLAVRRDAAELLVMGGLALGMQDLLEDRNLDSLVEIAFGADAFSSAVRLLLLTKPIPGPPDIFDVIPAWLVELVREIDRRTCITGVMHAVNDFGRAVSGTIGSSWATGIRSLVPYRGCAGQQVTIRGRGFGNTQPADVYVLFPNNKGRCSEASVRSWSDWSVEVVAPADVGSGCVGFARRPRDPTASIEAASTLAGELERCIGMAAAPIAYKLRTKTPVLLTSCPPCLGKGMNFFTGGPPSIDYFLVNGVADVTVEPNTPLGLSWDVDGANSMSISKSSSQGPFTLPPAPLPATGTHMLGPFTGSTPANAVYQISASNACGPTVRTVTAHLRKTPALGIMRIEVVQTIQRPNNSVRLVANKRTMVRVFVDSGITDGFNSGQGPNNQASVKGAITVWPAGGTQGFGGGPPLNPGGAIIARTPVTTNSNLFSHSLNFEIPLSLTSGTIRIDARVFVTGHEGDIGGPWTANASTTVTFQVQPTQEVLPVLVADGRLGIPAPPTGDFGATIVGGALSAGGTITGALPRWPLAETGFTVNPPFGMGTLTTEDLTTLLGWQLLLLRLRTMVFLFPSTPTGGIRSALITAAPQYATSGVLGLGTTSRSPVLDAPSFIAMAGDAATFAHEMMHTLNINHAPCGLPPGGTPDPRLTSATTEVSGANVAAGTIVPSGTPDTMCGTATVTDWPSITTWDTVFNSVPI